MRQSVSGQNSQTDEVQDGAPSGVTGKVLGGLLGLLSVPAALDAQEVIPASIASPPARVQSATALELASFGVRAGVLEEPGSDPSEQLDFSTPKEKSEWHNDAVQRLIDQSILTEEQCEDLNSSFSPLTLVYLWGFMKVEDALPSEPEKRKDFLTYAHVFLLGDSPVALPER